MTRHGCSVSRFQASQQWSTMAVYDANTRLESQLLRMNCQTFSTGLSSGHLAGSGTMVIARQARNLLKLIPQQNFERLLSRQHRKHPASAVDRD